jgi:alkanesulfonate monooxygenase
MGLEMIGMIGTRPASEIHPASGPILDPNYVRDFARAHEDGGFDRILIGYYSAEPDGFLIAQHAAASTERLGLLLAHRPGFVAPTLAARKLATLDVLSGGRLALHVISGGDDADQRKDGDWLGHDDRYRRTDEYIDILKRVWTSDGPIDHEGEFYRFKGAFAEIHPLQRPYVPIYFGGASDAAVEVGAKQADVYMLWGEPLADVRQRMADVRVAAARYGRSPRFSLSVRPILAPTEAQAWERAQTILATINRLRGSAAPTAATAIGSQRLLDAARRGELHDRCLWTPIAAATGARGNTTALVGTPEQVAEALLDYYDAGVTTILIRGFDPLPDAIEYGRELLPLVHAEVARRDRRPVGSEQRA